MYRLTPLLLLPLLVPAGAGEKKFDPDARARAVAPYLDELTFAVAHLDLTRPDVLGLALKVSDLVHGESDDLDDKAARRWLDDFTRAGGKDVYFLFRPLTLEDPLVVVPLGAGASGKEIIRLLSAGTLLPKWEYRQEKGALVGGSADARQRRLTLKPQARPELARAFAAAGDTSAQFLVLPTADHRRVIEELLPTLPDELGGGPSTVLTRGLQWAAVGIDGPPKAALRVVVQSQDADSARKLRAWLENALAALGQSKDVLRLLPNLPKLAPDLLPKVAGDRLTLNLDGKQAAALIEPLVQEARAESARERSVNNLKQLALAMHNYHDAHKGLPAQAISSKDGKPLLSWRVAILPYIEQLPLYNQFRLDEPWDSPHNKKLIAQMPKIYRSPFSKRGKEGRTTYLVPVGKETAFPEQREGLSLPKNFPDGTSNTILVVEATDEQAVIWTKPDDLRVNPKKPHVGLVAKGRDRFLVAMADGSVRAVPANVSAQTLWSAFTRAGGEPLGNDWDQ
ncbi:MAG: DUF1559 domain-containing protein [Gemmataceae bacterium]|nr:DUF1559 domain-containing protein [Gemmataceae bacterium]